MSGGVHLSPLINFFLRLNFELGVNPTPQYGVERTQVSTRVAAHLVQMARDKALPSLYRKEVWIRSLPDGTGAMFDGVTVRDIEYALALADAYLDWLYSHKTA